VPDCGNALLFEPSHLLCPRSAWENFKFSPTARSTDNTIVSGFFAIDRDCVIMAGATFEGPRIGVHQVFGGSGFRYEDSESFSYMERWWKKSLLNPPRLCLSGFRNVVCESPFGRSRNFLAPSSLAEWHTGGKLSAAPGRQGRGGVRPGLRPTAPSPWRREPCCGHAGAVSHLRPEGADGSTHQPTHPPTRRAQGGGTVPIPPRGRSARNAVSIC